MTIEKKMEQMIASMDALTAALMKISGLSTITTPETHAPESVPQVAHEIKAPEAPAPEVKKQENLPITLNDLSDLCLKLVRKNRGWKTKISATIKSFGGELLKDIAPEKYADLKTALEAIDAA